jgi:hypothetical protein
MRFLFKNKINLNKKNIDSVIKINGLLKINELNEFIKNFV